MQKTKKLLTIGITAIVFLWTLAMMPAASSAATINVPSPAYLTIQAAIDAAVLDDTVLVASGDYYESITMKSGVTIQGSGADMTTIQGDGSCVSIDDTHTYTVRGTSNSTISGFTITGSDYGIYNFGTSPTITNNIITGNDYGIYNRLSSPTITNNTITHNDYGIYNSYYSWWTPITNNIITSNGVGIWNDDDFFTLSSIISYNNDVWDNTPNYSGCSFGIGDISFNPLFVVDPAAGKYHLQADSPCIDAGSNAAPGLPATDSDGNPRIVDGDGDGTATVDMGAFEYQVSASNQPPVADGGPDQTVEATGPNGASVILDGSGSWDPDEDTLTYVWEWGEDGYAEGVNPTVTLPLGSTIITLTVSDGDLTNEDTVTITVEDTTPPIIEITYPSDGDKISMNEEIDVEYSVSDICDPDLTVTVTPEDPISPPLPIGELIINVTATDASGNEGSDSVIVEVLGPAGIKEEAVSELEAIDPSSRRVDRVINKVIGLIDKSLGDRYWVDDLHLDAKRGGKVFMYESLAVGKMKHHIKHWEKRGPTEEQEQAIGVFEAVIPKLVKADKLLAETAIDEATDAEDPWNPRKLRAYDRFLAKADKAFQKALGYMDKERPGRAIISFKQAWKFAQLAIKLAQ